MGDPLVSVLYISEQGATVKRSGQRIVVTADRIILAQQHVHQLSRVLVFGNVQIGGMDDE